MTRLRAWIFLAAALAGIAITVSLGMWQWGRARDKIALESAIESRREMPALGQDVLLLPPSPDLMHRRVALRGQWLPEATIYLDNRQMGGRPGFYVVTPLRLSGREAVVLVQRGWIPRDLMDRQRLAPVDTPAGEVELVGRIAPPPAKLYDFDPSARGPIRQNLDWSAYRAETRLPLVAGSVVQIGPASEGLLRDWPMPAGGADKNYGYAFQWWSLATVIFLVYVWFQFIAPARRRARQP